MSNKTVYADECFNRGFNCSQAVFSAFCEDFGLDKSQALKIACSFGAGMGYMGEACGAVTGAFMVLGLIHGQSKEADTHSKTYTYLLVKDFAARFRKINGTINCKELLGYDLGDEAQLNAARQSGVFKTKCPKYVSDAVGLLEEMIAEQKGSKVAD
ncbi:MAG: C_GCAxxG_C_C family protein [Clostridiaceae bacterium]|nr:C_GCAxxG_C_C family protein [Clostridiaceae bacterium]